MVGRSLVEGGTGRVAVEMFNPPEEDVLLNKNTHSALVHLVDVKKRRGGNAFEEDPGSHQEVLYYGCTARGVVEDEQGCSI